MRGPPNVYLIGEAKVGTAIGTQFNKTGQYERVPAKQNLSKNPNKTR
jgi:hypothetical protein